MKTAKQLIVCVPCADDAAALVLS
ncbi:uncharacterized protein METZ01_LOCUS474686, partial [marine metagenome]